MDLPKDRRETTLKRCSTPFGITDEWTHHSASLQKLLQMCSTPFGITDEWTRVQPQIAHRRQQCSTPFGITDEWTPVGSRSSVPASSAQRLSASRMNGPRRGWPWCCSGSACSTPFGITDEWTGPSHAPPAAAWRAQRLSASRMNGHQDILARQLVAVVLNAFRHHG